MKIKNAYLILIVLLGTMIILSNTVSANTSFALKLNSTKTTYSKGDTVTVSIDLSNVNTEDGISGYSGKMVYDSNVLEFTEIKADTNWEVQELSGAVIANTKDAEGDKTGTTAEVIFKVKEDTTASTTTVKMSNVKGSTRIDGSMKTVEGTSTELKINIGESSQETPSQCNHEYSVTKYDSTNHWKICSKCEAKQETSITKHSYDKAKNDGETHSYTCTGCGNKKTESHKFGTDGKCTANGCDAVQSSSQCNHDYSVTKYDSTNHWKICSKCEAKQTSSITKHSYDKAKNDGETHSYTCTGCGNKKTESHKFGTDGKCTASGCNAVQSSQGSSGSGSSGSGSSSSGSSGSGSSSSGSSSSGSSSSSKGNSSTTTTGKIPYAGAENVIGIVALVAIIGIASYIRYRKTF